MPRRGMLCLSLYHLGSQPLPPTAAGLQRLGACHRCLAPPSEGWRLGAEAAEHLLRHTPRLSPHACVLDPLRPRPRLFRARARVRARIRARVRARARVRVRARARDRRTIGMSKWLDSRLASPKSRDCIPREARRRCSSYNLSLPATYCFLLQPGAHRSSSWPALCRIAFTASCRPRDRSISRSSACSSPCDSR